MADPESTGLPGLRSAVLTAVEGAAARTCVQNLWARSGSRGGVEKPRIAGEVLACGTTSERPLTGLLEEGHRSRWVQELKSSTLLRLAVQTSDELTDRVLGVAS